MITWITENVAIGEYSDSVNADALRMDKIDCVLSLRGGDVENMCSYEEGYLISLSIPFYRVQVAGWVSLPERDDKIKIELKTAAYMLSLLANKYKRILVHCTAGIDRSPFVVAYWMIQKDIVVSEATEYDYTKADLELWLSQAYKFIKEKRPQIVEHMEWL